MNPSFEQTASHCGPAPRDGISGAGLAAIVAALYVVILSSRVSARHPHGPAELLLSWRVPSVGETAAVESKEAPSNPHRTYNVGQLALTAGMAVIALTRWLHIMRISGARTR
jgi:hypothetical protein